MGEQLGELGVAREGRPAGEHEVEDPAERVHVGATVDRVALDLFGRHVVDAAEELAGGSQAFLASGEPADPEVGQEDPLCTAVPLDQDVGGLDVSMDEALGVRRVEAAGDAGQHPDGAGGIQRPGRLDQAAQVDAVDEPHRQIELPALLARVVHRDHVRVLDLRGEPGLALEALLEAVVGRQPRRHHLQRSLAVECQMAGAIHNAHSPAADHLVDPVAGEGRARGQRVVFVRLGPRCRRVRHRRGSPAAARALSRSLKTIIDSALPSRITQRCAPVTSTSAPLPFPRP